MTGLPPELNADSGRDYLAGPPLTMIEAVRRQIDRIAYLRSTGKPWDEAVMQFRDMLVGLEDEEFYDGIPAEDRKRFKQALDNGHHKVANWIRSKYADQGWLGVPVRAVPGPNGRPIYKPTAANLSDMHRILLRLLHRNGKLWKTRRSAPLPPPEDHEA